MLIGLKLPSSPLPSSPPYQFEIINTPRYLVGFKQINLFVGLNNSGKSRFLRSIFSDEREFKYFTTGMTARILNTNLYGRLKANYQKAKNFGNNVGVTLRLKEEFDKILESNHLDMAEDFQNFIEFKQYFLNINQSDFHIEQNLSTNSNPFSPNINRAISQYKDVSIRTASPDTYAEKRSPNKIYIPLLRGLRPIQRNGNNGFNNNDSYLARTKFDYFQKNSNTLQIFTGLSMYEDVKKLLLGTEEERNKIAKFEKFLSENIFHKKVTLIPKYDEDVLHIKIGEERQRPIYDLGDGLQTIICILFPIFKLGDYKTMIFIEEPEVHLHPEWQLQLLSALKQFPKCQFFISTHSASFLNDEDSSIYQVKKVAEKSTITHIKLESQKLSIIKNLGYKPSDLFQTNYVLWVEGPSDKIYLEYLITKMDEELVEGRAFSIMFLGGDNYNHFLNDDEFDFPFFKNLNQHFGVVLDSDRKVENAELKENKERIQGLFEQENCFCWITKFREIENYIPTEIFEKAVLSDTKKSNIEIKTGDYDDRNTVIDKDAIPSFRPSIKLPQIIFQQIQKNGNGSTKGVDAKILRKGIEEALQASKKNTFRINKVRVAKEVIKLNPEIENEELKEKLGLLIQKIRKANNMT